MANDISDLSALGLGMRHDWSKRCVYAPVFFGGWGLNPPRQRPFLISQIVMEGR
ncbi:hypothetical protein AVEN_272024-1, partial [Araneus ventricosus]